ncbi:ester cyclase [Myxococcaceae bacterium GXIMD 01537]
MASKDSASIVRQALQAFNDRKFERMSELTTPDAFMSIVPFGARMGIVEDARSWAAAFSDARIELANVVAQGDCVIAEGTATGTHDGTLEGPQGRIEATNRPVEMRIVLSYRMRDGKLSEGRLYFDALSLMTQLGLVRQPGAAPAELESQH